MSASSVRQALVGERYLLNFILRVVSLALSDLCDVSPRVQHKKRTKDELNGDNKAMDCFDIIWSLSSTPSHCRAAVSKEKRR